MNFDDSNRYLRQISLKEFGKASQEKLQNASVLVVGAGALGCPALMYLTAAGVGNIGVLDADDVDITNLHRQVLYTNNDLGKPKVLAASQRLMEMNPNVKIDIHPLRLHRANALEILSKYDVIIDCTDNFPTKFLVNDACVILNKPCIIGGVIQFSGQLSVYNYNSGPTFRCFIAEEPDPLEAPSCSEAGVIGMVPGIIGTMQALEALKIITGIGKSLSGRLLNFNGLTMSFTEFEISPNPANFHLKELSEYELSCSDTIFIEKAISFDQFIEMLNEEPHPHIIALADDGIPLSALGYQWESIPLYELPNTVPKLPRNNDIILICHYGIKSLAALKYLVTRYGFDRVYHLKDGITSLSTHK
jgi:adenylyltransferase/sulfurtransferase